GSPLPPVPRTAEEVLSVRDPGPPGRTLSLDLEAGRDRRRRFRKGDTGLHQRPCHRQALPEVAARPVVRPPPQDPPRRARVPASAPELPRGRIPRGGRPPGPEARLLRRRGPA